MAGIARRTAVGLEYGGLTACTAVLLWFWLGVPRPPHTLETTPRMTAYEAHYRLLGEAVHQVAAAALAGAVQYRIHPNRGLLVPALWGGALAMLAAVDLTWFADYAHHWRTAFDLFPYAALMLPIQLFALVGGLVGTVARRPWLRRHSGALRGIAITLAFALTLPASYGLAICAGGGWTEFI